MDHFSWPDVLEQLLSGDGLTRVVAHDAMAEIMAGAASDAQVGAFLVALRAKGETADEMTILASVPVFGHDALRQ